MGRGIGRILAAVSLSLLFIANPSLAQSRSGNTGTVASNLAANNASRIASLLANAGRAGNRADNGHNKISADLAAVIAGRGTGREKWVTGKGNGALVDVLILANAGTADSRLNGLRLAAIAGGATFGRNFRSVPGISARLPAALVARLATRSDVWRIVPNRTVMQASSALELITGADDVRTMAAGPALDGSGVGIAFVDSGIMSAHGAFVGNDGLSRVKMSVDFTSPLATPTTPVDGSSNPFQDPYGHGTLVASVAAGRSVGNSLDSTGVAPNASLYDVRVLDATGVGTLATTLAGIDWVVNNAAAYNIKVLNISLGTNSTDTYLEDPLCVAVRNAVAAGITVIVAAGNYGEDASGNQVYGSISSPGDEPSAITVGSANAHDTSGRAGDTVNFFSSRGPTRGSFVDANGATQYDNLLKPDLVSPGNRVIGSVSTDVPGLQVNNITSAFPQLVVQQGLDKGLMQASGTSFATPVVTGAVALIVQANPGLTPPLIKAILQYTSEPLAGSNLLQQGAGLVNIPGAIAVAQALDPSIASRVAAGTINVGDSMLAAGKTLPPDSTVIDGHVATWSQFAFMGGRYVLSGDDLLTQYQAAYNPQISWVGPMVTPVAQNGPAFTGALVSPGVISVTDALGVSDAALGTGAFTPSSAVATQASLGTVLQQGMSVNSQGIIISEGIIVSEGIIISEGIIVSEGLIVSEGIIVSEGLIVSEYGPMPGE
jgi:subtilisin family serine protease